MSKPVTSGGFSNDGARIMQQTKQVNVTSAYTTTLDLAAAMALGIPSTADSYPVDKIQPVTISTALFQSELSLDSFYTIPEMAEFISQQYTSSKSTGPFPIAIQSPDELLADCSFITAALKQKLASIHKYVDTDTVFRFYVLGDTSYSQCCVDTVAAGHVDARVIVHLGFACLSPVSISTPVYYAFGVRPLCHNKISNCQQHLYRSTFALQSLVYRILSSKIEFGQEIDYSPAYDDYDEYPYELVDGYDASSDKHQLLIFVDQRYLTQYQFILTAFSSVGFTTRAPPTSSSQRGDGSADFDEAIAHLVEYVKQHESSFPLYAHRHSVEVVFAFPSTEYSHTDDKGKIDHTLLTFAGYQIPVLTPPLAEIDNINQLVSSMTMKQRFHRMLNPSQYKMIILTNHLPLQMTLNARNTHNVFHPDPQSSTLLTHFAMNFTQHFVYSAAPLGFTDIDILLQYGAPWGDDWLSNLISNTIRLVENPQTSNLDFPLDEALTIELFSPSAQQSRVLSQRFYLVEKAKNCNRIGIVAGTLSSEYTRTTLRRLQTLLKDNDVKTYTIVIGKLNEAKLLNFGDITMFVVITCPMSVLFNFHNRHGQLYQTTIDQSNPLKTAQHNSSSVSTMIDMITPFECELAFNNSEFWWNGLYTTHPQDVSPNTGRFGVQADNIANVEVSNRNTCDKNNSGDDLEADEKSGGVRYSSIDNKYHQVLSKAIPTQGSGESEATSGETKQLVEQQTFGLIDPTTNKQLIYVKNSVTGQISVREREFTGLAQTYDLEEVNMLIQPGQHGTSEGYVRFDRKDDPNKI